MTTYNTSPEAEQLTACGGRMEDPSLYPYAFFHGQKVYFCHLGCLRAFESDPQAFMAGELEHPDPDTP